MHKSMSVAASVRDLHKSVAFYKDILDLNFMGYWNMQTGEIVKDYKDAPNSPYAGFMIGQSHFGLMQYYDTDPYHFGDSIIVNIEVEDIEKYYKSVKAKYAKVEAPENTPWGWRMIKVQDPDGYWIYLYTLLEQKA